MVDVQRSDTYRPAPLHQTRNTGMSFAFATLPTPPSPPPPPLIPFPNRFTSSVSLLSILAFRRRRAAWLCAGTGLDLLLEPDAASESELQSGVGYERGGFEGGSLRRGGGGSLEGGECLRGGRDIGFPRGFDVFRWCLVVGASRSSVVDSSTSCGTDVEGVSFESLGRRSIGLALGCDGLLSAFEYPAAALVLDLRP